MLWLSTITKPENFEPDHKQAKKGCFLSRIISKPKKKGGVGKKVLLALKPVQGLILNKPIGGRYAKIAYSYALTLSVRSKELYCHTKTTKWLRYTGLGKYLLSRHLNKKKNNH